MCFSAATSLAALALGEAGALTIAIGPAARPRLGAFLMLLSAMQAVDAVLWVTPQHSVPVVWDGMSSDLPIPGTDWGLVDAGTQCM